MNIRIAFAIMFICLFQTVNAQSPAQQIRDIQKNTADYINVESTDPDEEAARSNAMRQMIDMARNFVDVNNNGAFISDAAIEKTVKSIVIPRGDFKRVFLYASRAELLQASGDKKPIDDKPITKNIESENPVNIHKTPETKTPETVATEAVEPTKVEKRDTVVRKERPWKRPKLKHDKPVQTAPSEPVRVESHEEFEKNVPEDIKVEIGHTAKVSPAIKEMIGLIQNASGLEEAAKVLYKYEMRNIVSAYGKSRECRNSAVSYWVVEDNGVVTVLGPEIRGHRNNFRTGKPDALHRYERGIWFRKR